MAQWCNVAKKNLYYFRIYANLAHGDRFLIFEPPKSPLSGGLMNVLRKSYIFIFASLRPSVLAFLFLPAFWSSHFLTCCF